MTNEIARETAARTPGTSPVVRMATAGPTADQKSKKAGEANNSKDPRTGGNTSRRNVNTVGCQQQWKPQQQLEPKER
jgi:hypothetical protein